MPTSRSALSPQSLWRRSPIREAAGALRRGESTPTQLLDGCLANIAQADHELRAWVLVDEDEARRSAEKAERERALGLHRGPLHGVPLGVKDIIDVAGWPTLAGSRTRQGRFADSDAALVARLREAGAVLIGKTVTTEFACFDPPLTLNPWNLRHTPGGSSSGSAAAVASGMCLGAIGTQTGGSIIRPAAYCGVAGFKPTHGLVSTVGVVPVSPTLDHPGPLASSIVDCAAIAEALRPGLLPADFAKRVASDELFPLRRSGPPTLWTADWFWQRADDETQRLFAEACDALRAAGATIEQRPLPDGFEELHAMHRRIMAFEAADYHRAAFAARRNQYGRHLQELLDSGTDMSTADYLAALSHRDRFRRAAIEQWGASGSATPAGESSVWLTPATPAPAPPRLDTTGDPQFNAPWSYAGFPAATFSCRVASTGAPMGLQLAGGPWTDAGLLTAAAWCEAALSDFR